MRFKDHAKLIDKCHVMTRIEGNEYSEGTKAFFEMKRAIITPCLQELIDHAAMQLSKAGLVGEHLVTFNLIIHAQEIYKEHGE